MRSLALLTIVAVIGCAGTSPTAPGRTLRVSNSLATPIAIGVDGTQRIGWVDPGGAAVFSIPESAATLQYSPVPFTRPDGSEAPSDTIGTTIQLAAGDQDVGVDNRSGGDAIFYVDLSNATGAPIDPAIVVNGVVRCLGPLDAGSRQQYGYFHLTPTTELRYYRSGRGCSGETYVMWSTATIQTLLTHAGALSLRAVFAA